MEADAHAFFQVTGRSVRPTRIITALSAEVHRLVTQTSLWETVPSLKTLRLVVDETHNGPFAEFTGSLTTRLLLSLVASAAQAGSSLTLDAISQHLYKICLSRFDGRHYIDRAGTYLKCTCVLDL